MSPLIARLQRWYLRRQLHRMLGDLLERRAYREGGPVRPTADYWVEAGERFYPADRDAEAGT